MKAKVVLNLLLVLLLTGLSLYAYFRPGEQAAPALKVSQLKRDDVVRISVEHRGSPTIHLEKKDGSWRLTAPLKTRADPYQVDRLLDIANASSKQKLPSIELDRFDLDPPVARVTLNDQVFSFGRVNDITYEQYLATGDAVHLVAPLYGYGIPTDASKLVSRKLLDDSEVPVAFDFGRYRIIKDDKGNWGTEGAFPTRKDKTLSQDDFNHWADEWRLTSSLTTQPHRGGRGKERLTVRLKVGKIVPMEILQKDPDFLLVRSDENMQYRFGAEVGRRLLDPYVVAEK